ncbi:RNA polymerase sigma factor SigK [Embleya hyalina]|uniref:RNA polymerase sigma factor SigK n=1 Tax=Embleya hyalina TaxID=516124 RepID=A0A401YDG1_9ACTN|nr:RNA polymerase sigma factor SigK [Embleya hyalina]
MHDRLVQGDESALAEVYDCFVGLVHSVAMRVSGNRTAAEDIVQEVFVHLWEHPYAFRPERGSLRGWLCLLAHRRAVDWVRAEHARERRVEHACRTGGGEWVASAEDSVVAADEAARVRSALARLPAAQREAIELAFYADITYREVASRLGVPEGTVKSRMRGGLRQLATLLGNPSGRGTSGEGR